MSNENNERVEIIDIESICIVNPRVRTRKSFRELRDSISEVGLKRPITVAARQTDNGVGFDLVCGQGRLEACQSLGQTTIPAIVKEYDVKECLLQSLVENCARRKHDALDLLQDIEAMTERGYTAVQIGKKTGLTLYYVRDIIRLLKKGERRLVRAVEAGRIPLTVAIEIAEADDKGVQAALSSAYEKHELRGRKLMNAKLVIEQRLRHGKNFRTQKSSSRATATATSVLKAYRDDAARKQMMVKNAHAISASLLFVDQAFRTLLTDDQFVDLLHQEGLNDLPRELALRLTADKAA